MIAVQTRIKSMFEQVALLRVVNAVKVNCYWSTFLSQFGRENVSPLIIQAACVASNGRNRRLYSSIFITAVRTRTIPPISKQPALLRMVDAAVDVSFIGQGFPLSSPNGIDSAKDVRKSLPRDNGPRTNARMGGVDRNWTKYGGRLSSHGREFC